MEIAETETAPSSSRRILAGIIKLEEALLSILLTAMIVLACYQIGLRWFTSGGLPWIDPLLRYLVLWSGLLGAVLATAKDNHIPGCHRLPLTPPTQALGPPADRYFLRGGQLLSVQSYDTFHQKRI